MIDIIKPVLISRLAELEQIVPQTKKSEKRVDISDVTPMDLPGFTLENDIPVRARFDGQHNGYDGWEPGRLFLSWTICIPTTDEDKKNWLRTQMRLSFDRIYHPLVDNGYKRISSERSEFETFDDTTVYDMVIGEEWERLEQYYSLSFEKI